MLESAAAHRDRRTAARASLKVRSPFWYQAAPRGRASRRTPGSLVQRVTRENKPSRAGVVRAMALSDHWRCVSTPRGLRTAAKVTTGPAADKPTQDIERIGLQVRAQERLRLERAGDIAHQNIADRDVLARMMPDRRA